MAQVDLVEIALGVFHAELAVIRLNLQGWLKSHSPLCLHDLRVANRRTRAGLRTFREFFPEEVQKGYRADFRWIQQVTSEARDLDIYLQDLPGLIRKIPRFWRAHLAPLEAYFQDRQKLVCEKMAGDLTSEKLRGILAGWSGILESGVMQSACSARHPAREFGCNRILERYLQALEDGNQLSESSSAKTYHLYRILIKGLRYRMDFFQPVLQGRRFSRTVSRLKKVQDAFGSYQDKQVQVAFTEAFLEEGQSPGLPVDTSPAAGKLLGLLERNIQTNQKKCLRQVSWLISERTARTFQGCFQRV